MGRYDERPDYDVQDGHQFNPYSMKNNSSLMLDQTSADVGIRRSLMDLPRKLADYQKSRDSNRGEKELVTESMSVDGLAGRYLRASVEAHNIGHVGLGQCVA